MEQIIAISLLGLFSGFKNGLYYTHAKINSGIILSMILCAIVIFFTSISAPFYGIAICFSSLSLVPYFFIMKDKKTDKVHFWENILMYSFYIISFICGVGLISLFCGMIINLFLFNYIIRWYKFGVDNKYFRGKISYFARFTDFWNTDLGRIEVVGKVNKKKIFRYGWQLFIAAWISLFTYIIFHNYDYNIYQIYKLIF